MGNAENRSSNKHCCNKYKNKAGGIYLYYSSKNAL